MSYKNFRYLSVLLITLLAVALPLGRATADLGPKPTIEFTFQQDFEGEPVTIVSGVLLQCDTRDCTNAHPLEQIALQYFRCEALICTGQAYGFSKYGQLEITFSDGKVRKSNAFAIDYFASSYNVTIRSDALVVQEHISLITLLQVVLCLCCCAVVAAVAIFFGMVVVIRRRTT